MKRKVALVLLCVFTVTCLFPLQAFAAYDKELEKAISTAKKLFKISDGYDNFNYSIIKQNDRTFYELMWNDSRNKLGSINVTISPAGKVTNYGFYRPYDERNIKKLPAVSKADARKTAENFIKKLYPESWSKVSFQPNNIPMNINERSYHFSYLRIEKGIPYPDNGIYISVDGMTGEVQNFNYNWNDDVVFPEPQGVMGLEEAQKKYVEKLGLKFAYRLAYDSKEQKPYLVYTNVYNNKFLDAKTGEVVNGGYYYGNPYYSGYGAMGKGEADGPRPLTPKEEEAVKSAADILDQDKAEELIRKLLKIDAGYKVNHVGLYNNWQDKNEYIWNMSFLWEEKGKDPRTIDVSVDARTGGLMNFYRSGEIDLGKTVRFNREQSLKIAEDFIRSVAPERFREVEETPWNEPVIVPMDGEQPRENYFNFIRKTNGVYFIDNGINVAVENVNGSVLSYSSTWYKKPLPPADKALTADKAHEILFKEVGLQLQYISTRPDEDGKVSKILPPEQQKPEIRLGYAIKTEKPANIDANTGQILSYGGKLFKTGEAVRYTDIKGSFAENQIKVLAEYGIALPGTKLMPNRNITQREFLSLLYKATISYGPVVEDEKTDDDLYNQLIQAGIVKEGERAPGAALTRQDAVKFLIRALKYDKVAEIKGIYTLPFKDAGKIKPDLYGYMAIAYGLKLIQGDKGLCSPNGVVTRAQAFVLLYNFLNVQ